MIINHSLYVFFYFPENYCNSKFEYKPPTPIIVKPSTRPPSVTPETEKDNHVLVIVCVVVITIALAVGLASLYVLYKRKTSQPFGPLPQQDHEQGLGRAMMPQNQSSIVPLR